MVGTEQQDDDFSKSASEHIGGLCKPPGSLGALETIAINLCVSQQSLAPATRPRRTVIFAADHGVNAERVSAWPSEVTRAVVSVMRSGRSASGVFCVETGCEYEIVDIGLLSANASSEVSAVDSESPKQQTTPYHETPVRHGTSNFLHQSAMTKEEFDTCWKAGSARATDASKAGIRLVVGGEMGIANTSSASCIYSLLLNIHPEQSVGPGAGADEDGLARKRDIVQRSITRVRESLSDNTTVSGAEFATRVACEVGGFEIVALAGFFAEAASLGLTIILDGFIATAAALLAEAIQPGTAKAMLAGHCSQEPAHRTGLDALNLSPILDLDMRLGEGTGALAALGLIDLAAAMTCKMAKLSDLELG